jgi:hypothetical protein
MSVNDANMSHVFSEPQTPEPSFVPFTYHVWLFRLIYFRFVMAVLQHRKLSASDENVLT